MGWESSDIVSFDLDPLLQGQTRTANLKVLISCLLLILEVCNLKPTYRISWTRNLLMSDLTFGPSFKVSDGSMDLVSCLSGGYKFASVL